MNLLYISCHEVLEYDKVSLLSELGYNVFSTGVYAYPFYRNGMRRPSVDTLQHYPHLERLASTITSSGYFIPDELMDWAEVVVCMGGVSEVAIIKNWPKLKTKKVVWRTIGQSTPHNEEQLKPMRQEGLKIIRYSPKEANIKGFIGQDAMIRFYKDEDELCNWRGNAKRVINVTQSLKGQRSKHCHYNEVMAVLKDFPAKVYGSGNENLGSLWGGKQSWSNLKEKLKENRAFLYSGTYPASYTLGFIEAWMTGIPVVAIGSGLAQNIQGFERINFYEIEDLIVNGENGFYSDDIDQLRSYVKLLLEDQELAKKIGEKGRESAIKNFGKEMIKKSWKEFIDKLYNGDV